jgi:hypothetical protein
MTTKEYLLVISVTLIGLIPSYFVYEYAHSDPTAVKILTGGGSEARELSQATLASVIATQHSRTIAEVYQSQPQKETAQLCKNSYYMSFALTLRSNGEFSLIKRCESARDSLGTWFGVASSSWVAMPESDDSQTRQLLITKDAQGASLPPLTILLVRHGSEVRVLESSLDEMGTTTNFTLISPLIPSPVL